MDGPDILDLKLWSGRLLVKSFFAITYTEAFLNLPSQREHFENLQSCPMIFISQFRNFLSENIKKERSRKNYCVHSSHVCIAGFSSWYGIVPCRTFHSPLKSLLFLCRMFVVSYQPPFSLWGFSPNLPRWSGSRNFRLCVCLYLYMLTASVFFQCLSFELRANERHWQNWTQ